MGQVRDGNEDNYVTIEGLYFVADGMGGHSAGEVASEIAVRILREVYTDPKVRVSSPGLLADAISTANTAIYMEAMHDTSKTGMGTTLTGLAVTNAPDNQIVVANVGDSRTYMWRHGELRQVTKDHSHVQTLVDRGAITRAEARVHFQRNIVLRAMGIESWVDIDTFPMSVEDGDRFIMCSDGLVDEADDDEIETEIRLSISVQDLADRLVDLANRNGGRDNITVVVVDFAVSDEVEVPANEVVEIPPVVEQPTVTEPAITEEIAVVVEHLAPTRPSRWFTVATYAMWLASLAITATVIISAITSSQ
ncbi:MAG: Stp1/IreP family PP2C-type Ser/Thr phosphatase [Actinomycetes bacterium]